MVRNQVTLQGSDAERFRDTREKVGDLRSAEPSNAELVRMMMDQFDPSVAVPTPDQDSGVL